MFNSGTGDCDKCNDKCLNCSPDVNTCIGGCADGTRNLTENCACNSHTYSQMADATCDQTCNYICGDCAEITGTCSDCSDATRDFGDSCNCRPGFFDDGGNNALCGTCNNTICATCVGNANNCTLTCDPGCTTCDTTGKCTGGTCIQGYMFNSGTGDCDKCNDKCLNCSPDVDTCIGGCADGTRNLTENCACNFHTFSLTIGQTCDQPCDYKCGNCAEQTGVCSDCSDPSRDFGDSCKCRPGFFDDGGNNALCGTCNNTACATCQGNANNCTLTCDTGCDTCNTDGSCIGCATGFMFNTNGDGTCIPCNKKCLNCSPDIDTCIGGCADATRNLTDNCACNRNAFSTVLGETCDQVCDYKCEKCVEVTGVCNGCADPNRNPMSGCACRDGYFEDGTNNPICGTCDNTVCATCITNSTNCQLECNVGCVACETDGYCVNNECKVGYYHDSNDNLCKKCLPQCEECEGSPSNCTKCKNQSDNLPECNCDLGQFTSFATGLCEDCSPLCNVCSGVDMCQECKDENRENLDCRCKMGMIEDPNTGLCVDIDHSCEKLSVLPPIQCIECSDRTRENAPECDCKPGYVNKQLDAECINMPDKCEVFASVDASSIQQGNIMQFHLNNEKIKGIQKKSGINLLVLSEDLTGVDVAINFDISDENQVSAMVDFINDINQGRQVMISTYMIQSIQFMDQKMFQALEQLGAGSDLYNKIDFNGTFVMIGKKGLQAGDGHYKYGDQDEELVSVYKCLKYHRNHFYTPQQQSFEAIGSFNNQLLLECDAKCERCEGRADNCLSCQGDNRNDDAPDCSCKDGFTASSKDSIHCDLRCPSNCIKCNSEMECLECMPDSYLQVDQFSKQCVCEDGYFREYYYDIACIKCYTYKNQCYKECPLNTQVGKDGLICEEIYIKNQKSLILPIGIFLIGTYFALYIMYHSCLKKQLKVFEFARKKQAVQNNQNNGFNNAKNRKLSQQESQNDLVSGSDGVVQDLDDLDEEGESPMRKKPSNLEQSRRPKNSLDLNPSPTTNSNKNIDATTVNNNALNSNATEFVSPSKKTRGARVRRKPRNIDISNNGRSYIGQGSSSNGSDNNPNNTQKMASEDCSELEDIE